MPESESVEPSKISPSQENTLNAKFLVPVAAAGAVIGKDGSAITSIQKRTGAKFIMSKQNEHYPGTFDRICLISGTLPAVMEMFKFIFEQIAAKKMALQGHENEPINSNSHDGRSLQAKVIIPNSTAGIIIGKSGSYIRQIQQDTGAMIQISQKPKDLQQAMNNTSLLNERCITVHGDVENCTKVVEIILNKLMLDPMAGASSGYATLNYTFNNSQGPMDDSSRRNMGGYNFGHMSSDKNDRDSHRFDSYFHENEPNQYFSPYSGGASTTSFQYPYYQDRPQIPTREIQISESMIEYILQNMFYLINEFDVSVQIQCKDYQPSTRSNRRPLRLNMPYDNPYSKWRTVTLSGSDPILDAAVNRIRELTRQFSAISSGGGTHGSGQYSTHNHQRNNSSSKMESSQLGSSPLSVAGNRPTL